MTARLSLSTICSRLCGNRLRIIMYHSVADNPRDPHAVPPRHFAAQMAGLAKQNTSVISLAEALRLLHKNLSLRGRIVLSFDDAYRDFVTNALPVLQHFGHPATLFVPTGLLGGTAVWDSYDQSKQLMDWDELKEVRRRGVTIASHTVTHARLTACDDRQLEYELRASLDTLGEQLGSAFPALSYPGGYHGPREEQAARRAGYVCALGAGSWWGNGPETDAYRLRRENPARRHLLFRMPATRYTIRGGSAGDT